MCDAAFITLTTMVANKLTYMWQYTAFSSKRMCECSCGLVFVCIGYCILDSILNNVVIHVKYNIITTDAHSPYKMSTFKYSQVYAQFNSCICVWSHKNNKSNYSHYVTLSFFLFAALDSCVFVVVSI